MEFEKFSLATGKFWTWIGFGSGGFSLMNLSDAIDMLNLFGAIAMTGVAVLSFLIKLIEWRTKKQQNANTN